MQEKDTRGELENETKKQKGTVRGLVALLAAVTLGGAAWLGHEVYEAGRTVGRAFSVSGKQISEGISRYQKQEKKERLPEELEQEGRFVSYYSAIEHNKKDKYYFRFINRETDGKVTGVGEYIKNGKLVEKRIYEDMGPKNVIFDEDVFENKDINKRIAKKLKKK